MKIEVTVPGRPVAKQRARRGKGGHWFTPTRTRQYEELVAWHCRAAVDRVRAGERCDIDIRLCFRDYPQADPDNYAKSILDGMVKGELIPDDDVSVIRRLSIATEVGLELELVEIQVKRIDDGLGLSPSGWHPFGYTRSAGPSTLTPGASEPTSLRSPCHPTHLYPLPTPSET